MIFGSTHQGRINNRNIDENDNLEMNHATKRNGLLLFLVALVALLLLATSLSGTQLAPGTPIFLDSNSTDSTPADEVVYLIETQPLPLLQGIMALGFVCLVFYLGYRIYRYVSLRIIIWAVLGLIFLFSLAIMLPRFDMGSSAITPSGFSAVATPIPELAPPVALGLPPWIIVGFVVLVVIGPIAWLAIKILQQRLISPQTANPVLDHAQQAVEDLYAGMELRNVVLRCYMQMALSLQQKHGIQRQANMTVREFERWLTYEGFPAVPVHQLTSLFEKMRYSTQNINAKADEAIAIESLNAIIQSTRKGRNESTE